MATQIPSKCKAMVAEKPGADLVLKEVEIKAPAKGQVLVKTVACGVCHTDRVVQQGLFGTDLFPRILGHEIVGDIVAVGPDETKFKVGDRVGGGWHGGHDMMCTQCRRGKFQLCDKEAINGVSQDGGYSEYCLLRSEAVATLPLGIDPAMAAPLLCAGVTVYNSVRNMHIMAGETVAIQGLGGLGHLGVQYIRKMGYRTVALSSSGAKRDFATQLGATDYIDGSQKSHSATLQEMGGAALIVVTAPNPQIISDLLKGLAPGGKLLILAPVGDVAVDSVSMISKSLSVHGWSSGHALDSEEAIQFARIHDVQCMVETCPLEEANEALARMDAGKVRFRGVLTF